VIFFLVKICYLPARFARRGINLQTEIENILHVCNMINNCVLLFSFEIRLLNETFLKQ
jgi:hypothetical protein